jgi:hypothetical protein
LFGRDKDDENEEDETEREAVNAGRRDDGSKEVGQDGEEQFLSDLPSVIKKNPEAVRRLREGDIKAKKFYDQIDNQVETLRNLRLRIARKKSSSS